MFKNKIVLLLILLGVFVGGLFVGYLNDPYKRNVQDTQRLNAASVPVSKLKTYVDLNTKKSQVVPSVTSTTATSPSISFQQTISATPEPTPDVDKEIMMLKKIKVDAPTGWEMYLNNWPALLIAPKESIDMAKKDVVLDSANCIFNIIINYDKSTFESIKKKDNIEIGTFKYDVQETMIGKYQALLETATALHSGPGFEPGYQETSYYIKASEGMYRVNVCGREKHKSEIDSVLSSIVLK